MSAAMILNTLTLAWVVAMFALLSLNMFLNRSSSESDLLLRIDMLEDDVVKLYQQNQHYKRAIDQHCHLTESITPDYNNPYATIDKVISWHIQTNRDWEKRNG